MECVALWILLAILLSEGMLSSNCNMNLTKTSSKSWKPRPSPALPSAPITTRINVIASSLPAYSIFSRYPATTAPKPTKPETIAADTYSSSTFPGGAHTRCIVQRIVEGVQEAAECATCEGLVCDLHHLAAEQDSHQSQRAACYGANRPLECDLSHLAEHLHCRCQSACGSYMKQASAGVTSLSAPEP